MKLNIDLGKLLPSELIRLALTEARSVAASESDRLCMDVWVVDFGTYCKMCFSGAIMLRYADIPDTFKRGMKPSAFDSDTCRRLCAIDKFREGKIEDGLELCSVMSQKMEEVCPQMEEPMAEAWEAYRPDLDPDVDTNGELCYDDVFAFMEEIARILAVEGL